jgi:ribonuclease HI
VKGELGTRRTKLVYVPGHAGVALNERADELAREAVRSRRSTKSSTEKKTSTE